VEKDSAWGFFAFVALMLFGVLYYKVLWWWGWKRSRGQLPVYGQSWASSSGRRLYIIGIGSEVSSKELIVQFTDVDPSMHETFSSWKWSMRAWRDQVDRQRLVLDDEPWTARGMK
jgi:hypothetical protein